MAALQYVDIPGYSALLLRKTYADLTQAEGLITRAHEWLGGTDAKWNAGRMRYEFPSNATVAFGYMQDENDKFRYRGGAYQFIGFDELTDHTVTRYVYMFSRLRKLTGVQIPLRLRSTGNPDGPGGPWVYDRFVNPKRLRKDRIFIKATLDDNKYLDREAYELALSQLDPVAYAQLRHGDWTIRASGNMFKRESFEIVKDYPRDARIVRRWDLAATEVSATSPDPDWTAGAKIAFKNGIYWVVDMKHDRLSPGGVKQLVGQTAAVDGRATEIYAEEEPGSAGKSLIHDYATSILAGYPFRGIRSTGDKTTRAKVFSAAAFHGNVKLVDGPWIEDFLDELTVFPREGFHDDMVDCTSSALIDIAENEKMAPEAGVFSDLAPSVWDFGGGTASRALPARRFT